MREEEKRPEVPDIGGREDDELSQYGDEQDAPVRRRRSAKAAASKKKAKKRCKKSFFSLKVRRTAPKPCCTMDSMCRCGSPWAAAS